MDLQSLKKQLTAQFYRGNLLIFSLAVFAALAGGSLNLIVSWIMQQLIDAASGIPGALSLGTLAKLTGGFVLLCAAFFLLKYASEPRFIERGMRQYKDFAFRKLTEKSISSFREESTAAYLSALTNDAGSIEADYLSQQLSVITKVVTFFGALAMMLWYSPLLTAVAVGVTALPLAASLLTGNQLQAAERRVSDRNRDFTAALTDCLSGFTVVKTFKAEKEIFSLFAENNRALEGEKFSRRRLKVLVGMIGAVTGVIAQLGVFLVGAWLALAGRGLTAGTVILFVNLMNFMIEPVAELPALLAGRQATLGQIFLDGTELRNITPESLYEMMSVIQQNVFVFNASIKDNVSMFREFPQRELDEAIRHAHLSELLAERGEGYLCGENGSGLSGGEKQRISIARSLLKKSSVLLADEVTAALDAQTAHQVSGDILDLHGMTRIVVTHTLEEALLRQYDGILVLKNGEITEAGSFDELMAKKGYFYALYTVSQ